MRDNPSQKRQSMAKDASSINILTCESYINRTLPAVPYEQLFDGIFANEKFLFTDKDNGEIKPVSKEYLLDSKNWVSNSLLNKV